MTMDGGDTEMEHTSKSSDYTVVLVGLIGESWSLYW